MPVSKTAALEKRIGKLEQELAAYKRQLTQRAPGENAAVHELAAVRAFVRRFFNNAEEHGVRFWIFHPDVANAAEELARAAGYGPLQAPTPTNRRTPQ